LLFGAVYKYSYLLTYLPCRDSIRYLTEYSSSKKNLIRTALLISEKKFVDSMEGGVSYVYGLVYMITSGNK